jgi:membrane protease YdiL (CAAX protease family)
MELLLEYAMGALPLALLAGSILVWVVLLQHIASHRPPAEYEPRAPVPWSGVDLILLGTLVLLLQAFAVNVATRAYGAPTSVPSVASMTAIVGSRIVWLLFALVYLARKVGAYADDMGFDTRRLKSDLRLAGLTFLAAVLPVYGTQLVLTSLFGYESEHPLVKLVNEQPSLSVMVMTTIAAVGVAPLVEEFLLRVLLQGWLEKKQIESRQRRSGNPDERAGWGPIVVAAAIFALLHGWPDMLALFILSLFMGYVYQRTHRIIAPLAVHMCVNALAVLELWKVFLLGQS